MNKIALKILKKKDDNIFYDFEEAKNKALELSKQNNVDYIVYMPGFDSERYELCSLEDEHGNEIPSVYIMFSTKNYEEPEEPKENDSNKNDDNSSGGGNDIDFGSL